MAEAHNHHFVPQGYLRHFANGVGRKAKVNAFDLTQAKRFETLVRNVASQRDFNRIDAEGQHPNALEDAYAEFEAEAAPAIARIVSDKKFAGRDRDLVLNLMALLGVRHPKRRKTLGNFFERVYKSVLQITVRDEATWRSMSTKAAASGYIQSDAVENFEVIRDFINSDEFGVVTHQNEFIKLEIESFETMLRCLADRKWHLYLSDDGESDFVTSDNPLCLGSTIPRKGPYGLGFGLPHTFVAFPLTRRAGLWGTFENEEGCHTMGTVPIAEFNTQVIRRCDRQVYARDDAFFYLLDGALVGGERLISDVRLAKRPPG